MKKHIYSRLITLAVLLSATLQAAAADKITKTETYEFCYYSDDGLASNDQDEPCWIGQNGYHFWSDQASAVGARCNAYDNVYILSKVTFPSVVKKVIITAGAWSDVSTSLSVNGSAKSLYTINSSQYRGNESNISFSDYEFNDVSTSGYDGKLRIDYVLGGQADIFIRSITVQYEVDPDPETYAVLSDDNTVLTFYYDNEKGDKEGALSVVPFNNLEMQSWYSSRENITSVVFNSSFANCDTLTSTAYWFYGCKNLTSITGIENLKTDIVTKMNNMFSDCYSLTSLDVSNFNTENVTNMSAMFSGCSGLSVLDLSKFNTANVKDMAGMFDGCSGLTTIYVGYYWSTVNVENSYDMFDGCTAIFGEADTRYDSNNTDATYAHIDGGTENPGYLTDTKEPYAILSENNTVLTFYYDNQKDLKNGMSVGPFANSTSRPWNGKSSNIKTVVFDESFANCASIESTAYWFCNFMNLTVVTNLEYLNTTNVTNMNSMFDTCFKVESLDVSNFDTRNVTDMGKTFYLCMNLKSLDVSKFDTRNVTDMSSMFAGNQSLTSLDISNFNTQNVTSMLGMFSGCSSLTSLDVSLFNVDKVTSFEGMFRSCSNLTAIYCDNTWIKDYVDSNGMFLQCTSLSNYDSSRDSNNYPIEYARPVAYGGYFTPTSEKENPNVISEPYAVLSEENTILTFYYDDQKDTRGGMSVGPFNKGEDSGWFNLNSTITTVVFDDSFAKCTSLTSTAYWFYMCQKLTNIMGVENLKTNKVTDMSWMFSNCNVLNSVDVSGFSTYNVTNMSNMFLGCYALTNLNVSNFNTTNVTDMSGMFEECRSLATLDVSNFNTSKVTTMSYMFDHCESLTVLDLCNFNTSKLSDVSHMFSDSKNLTTIYVENDWSHDGVSLNGTSMFEGAVSLVGGAGTAYNMYRIDYFYARIDEGTDNPGYFSKYAEAYAVLTDNEDNATKTLTFYYDNQKAERTNPLSIGPFSYVASWDSNKDKITAVVFDESFDNYKKLTSTYYWFSYCKNLATITGIEYLHTDNVTNMGQMFNQCESLTSLDVSHFNTEKVTNMNLMFCSCSKLTVLDVSGFNTANVNYMGSMFSGCSSVATLDVSHFNTERVIRMGGMFSGCSSLTSLDVSNFNTGQVIDMGSAFRGLKNLTTLDVSNLNTSNVTNMYFMFADNSNLTSLDLSNFNTAKVTRMGYMFNGCSKVETITVGQDWTTANIGDNSLDTNGTFGSCNALVGGAGTVYDSNHTDVSYAHIDGGETNPGYLSGDLPEPYAVLTDNDDEITNEDGTTLKGKTLTFYYDRKKADNNGMSVGPFIKYSSIPWSDDKKNITTVVFDTSFARCKTLTSTAYWFSDFNNLATITGIEYLHTDNVTDMDCMFAGCSGLTSLDLSNFKTDNVTNMRTMFMNCYGLSNLDVSNFNTASVMDMFGMFEGCSLTNLDLSNFNTPNVTDMSFMFYGCSGLTSLDLSNFNTANVEYMYDMFSGCSGLTSLDVSSFNTGKVTNMSYMFHGCSNLTSLDVSSFNTSNIIYDANNLMYGIENMFSSCSALTTIYVGEGWNVDNLTESADVFKGCTAIAGGAGTTYDAEHTDYTYAHIDGGPLNPGYLTEKKYAYASLNEDNTVLTFYYDGHKMDRGGMSIGPFSEYSEKGWYDQKGTITKVVFDDSFAQYTELTSTFTWFDLCSNLATVEGLSNLNTENVLNMRSMFEACSSLTSLDLSNFNTAKVKDFGLMFAGCTNLTTIYVGEGWSTEGVTEESTYMFADCTSLVGGASTSYDDEHKDATYARIDGGEDNPGYLTGKILEPYAVLKDNDDEVIVDEVTVNGNTLTFYYDGQKTGRNGMSVGPFNDSNNQSWSNARESITSVVFDASFANCTTLTSTTLWFSGLENLNSIIGIENLNTANVTDMRSMFYGCSSLTSLDVSNFNTANVTNMACMFYDCSKLTNLDVSKFNTANVTNMTGMFMRCFGLTNLDVSNFKTANVTDMSTMFCYCPNLTSLDVSNFNTTNVTDMYAMFNGCSSLTSLDVSNFSTVNVTRMNYMFLGCSGLTTIDVSNFNTAKVKLMNYMFKDCSELTTIYVGSGWSTASVTDGENLFTGCVKLVGGDGTEYSADHVDASYAHVDGGEDNPGYLTDKYGVVITVKECTREYGATNPKFEYTTKGAAISGKPTISCGATATSPVGTYPITVSYTKAEGESMLNITCVNGSMTITKAPLTITAKSYTIKRGEEMPTLEATYTGLKNRETDTVFTKKPVISTVAKPDTLPGTYPIVASGAEAKNYEMSYVDGTLTITDDVTVTANSYTRVYGDDNPTFEFTSEGATLSGTPAITCSATATSPVGTYDIVIAKGDITNSTVTCVNGTLTITKAPLTITAKSYTIKQGRALPTLEAEYSGFKNNETDTVFTKKPIVSTNATSDSEPGTYDITVSGAEATNYEMTYVNGILTITKKTESFDGIVLVVEENGNIDDAFESCGGKAEVAKTIAAVVWNDSTELKAEMLDGISNPNLLIYVGDEKLAPSGFNNVVINGVAKNIKLTDGGTGNYNFYVPQEFKADSISYSREFKQATRDSVSRGWEGIALPFTVQTFTHEEHGNISPFGNDACDYHFWLRQPTENGVVSAKTIEANKPYIISMPNSDEYEPEFNHAGWITFASANVTVPVTKVESVWLGDSAQIVPTFQNIEASPDIYVLNVGDSIMDQTEGSIFISNYRSARPFEVYTFHEPRGNETNIFGSRIISLSSLFGGNGTTGVNDAMKTAEPNGEKWYDMNGRRLQGKPTHKGVYIMNGKKVVIK